MENIVDYNDNEDVEKRELENEMEKSFDSLDLENKDKPGDKDKPEDRVDLEKIMKTNSSVSAYLKDLPPELIDEFLEIDENGEESEKVSDDKDWTEARNDFAQFVNLYDGLLDSECYKSIKFMILRKYDSYVTYRSCEHSIIAFIECYIPNDDMRNKALLLRANHRVRIIKVQDPDDREKLRQARVDKPTIDKYCLDLYHFLGNLLFEFVFTCLINKS